MNGRRVVTWVVIAALTLAMAGMIGKHGLRLRSTFEQADTTVWYCAGEAVNERKNPYLVEPLRTCEIRNEPSRHQPWVEPAPLPGYALAAFSVWARLPFDIARTLWLYLLIAALLFSAFALAKLSGLPVLLVLLCLALADGYFNLFFGELPPLAVAVLIAAAALGSSQRYVGAALIGSVAMIEPHLGLPACLAMFVWWPRTRPAFIAIGVGFALVSIAAMGVAANIQYLTEVLPVQAASEIAAQDQYSLTRLLHILGCADGLALKAGSASYLILTILGVTLARRVSSALGSEGLIVLLAPGLALLGGPFVHDIQMAAAIPAAIILAASARPPLFARSAMLVALVFPWHAWHPGDILRPIGWLEIGAAAAAALIATRAKSTAFRATAAVAAVAVCITLGSAIETIPRQRVGPPTSLTPLAVSPADLSSANWAAYVSRDRSYSTPDLRDACEKIPLWLGLITLTWLSLRLARNMPQHGAVATADTESSVLSVPSFGKTGQRQSIR